MSKIRCPFCHCCVDEDDADEHFARHAEDRGDGQQNDYITVPPSERYTGSLKGVPKVYRHKGCGGVTGMPEEIIRSYLVNPFLYSADATFCTGCSEHVPLRECVWTETGEDLQTYTDRLRSKAGRQPGTRRKKKSKPKGFWAALKRLLFRK